jgi:UDP-glucose 4-epimerase
MRILLTGASSFTGFWFARDLSSAGHEIVATFRGTSESYEGVRGRRVAALADYVRCVWQVPFGGDAFLRLVGEDRWDLLCHHAAEMTNYRSPAFDSLQASRANTHQCRQVLEGLVTSGCKRLVMTGSVFEPFEGVGDLRQRAFSPYGLSKHFSFELFRYEAERLGIAVGKFVIPNPFGPLEELRFTSHLAREWAEGRVPEVRTPEYVRDNIHVSLLSRAYATFCERAGNGESVERCSPSGYVESQGAFARRLADELGRHFGREFPLTLAVQKEFPEPIIRINTEPARQMAPDWSELSAWQDLCGYYDEMFFGRSPVAGG